MSRRRAAAVLACLATGLATAAPAAASPPDVTDHLPDRINLPRGYQPEGVTTDGRRLYVGSLADGSIRRVDPRTRSHKTIAAGKRGRVAVGVDHDARRGLVWVAGGATSVVRAHDARTGKVVRTYRFRPLADRFLNDLVVTRAGVFVTDSVNQRLAVVPLHGRKLPPPRAARILRLTGALEHEPGFNLNGIVASKGRLLAVQSNTGRLFRIDPASGRTFRVRTGGYPLTAGDGMELDGRLLHVVRNQLDLVATLELSPRLRHARLVAEQSSSDFDVPTTVALVGHSLWAVNARFGNPDPENARYWLTRVPAH
ncbi:superoxide dismutase [Nocardioides caldifontis]|uniref:superoxide dismutase n=1 Tax=Nocardioides caldifontis TaxID=2588938 RepID=UPI0011DF191D|nr:superoxide dismutase [Nocardioides caldifontis]